MLHKNFLKCFFMVVVLSLLSLSCSDSVQQGPLYAPEYTTPVVTGIIITNEDSADPIVVLGKPSNNHFGKVIYMVSTFPNPPINGTAFIRYSLPAKAKIKIWAVKAKTRGSLSVEGSGVFNAALVSLPEKIVVLPETESVPGYFVHQWNYSNNTQKLPAGFYRIYIQAGDVLVWDDILVDYDFTGNYTELKWEW